MICFLLLLLQHTHTYLFHPHLSFASNLRRHSFYVPMFPFYVCFCHTMHLCWHSLYTFVLPLFARFPTLDYLMISFQLSQALLLLLCIFSSSICLLIKLPMPNMGFYSFECFTTFATYISLFVIPVRFLTWSQCCKQM